jgi:hypothetical protein
VHLSLHEIASRTRSREVPVNEQDQPHHRHQLILKDVTDFCEDRVDDLRNNISIISRPSTANDILPLRRCSPRPPRKDYISQGRQRLVLAEFEAYLGKVVEVLKEEQCHDREDRGDDGRHLGPSADIGVESGARNTYISPATLLKALCQAPHTDSW